MVAGLQMIIRDTPALAGKLEVGLNIGDLNQEEKKLLWDHLKSSHQEYAKIFKTLLGSEPLATLVVEFSASSVIEEQYVPKLLCLKMSRF